MRAFAIAAWPSAFGWSLSACRRGVPPGTKLPLQQRTNPARAVDWRSGGEARAENEAFPPVQLLAFCVEHGLEALTCVRAEQ